MNRKTRTCIILAFTLFLLVTTSISTFADDTNDSFQILVDANRPPNAPLNPECENQTNPGDITTLTPYLDWIFSDPEISDTQGGFHIQVGDDSNWADGAEMWDSNQTANIDDHVTYGGLVLSDDTWYYWHVKTEDEYGLWGSWTATQQFKTVTPNVIIRDITILDNKLTELEVSVIVENAGATDQMVNLQWALKKTLNDKILDFGHNILLVTAGESRLYEVQPETEYHGEVYINFTGSGAYNQTTFETTWGGGAGGGTQSGGGLPPEPIEPGREDIPVAVDTDNDGLSDEVEEQVTSTDPTMPDTDLDGYTDYEEYISFTDPNDAGSTPQPGFSLQNIIIYIVVGVIGFALLWFVFFLVVRKRRRCARTA